jgi:hypothetical protein
MKSPETLGPGVKGPEMVSSWYEGPRNSVGNPSDGSLVRGLQMG